MSPDAELAPTRVLVIDDHALFRESLARLLNSEPGFEMAGVCGSVEEAVDLLARTRVDIVLLDFDLGGPPAAHFFPAAAVTGFQGRTVILTAGVSEKQASQLLAQGACGIFLKHRSPELLLECLRRVLAGETWMDTRDLTAPPRPEQPARGKRLTRRESEVLRLVFEGLGNKEIAVRLAMSESGVKSAMQQLFQKTGARNRAQLIRAALQRYLEEL